MANRRQVKLAENRDLWAEFRAKQPKVRPDLRGANLDEANLVGDFSGVLFDGAFLKGAYLPYQLNGASFIKASMRNAWLNGSPGVRAEVDRRNAIFRDAHMTDCKLMHANFDGADFSGADLRGARFDGALLRGANLTRTNLLDARFEGASLERAIFAGASLQRTSFKNAVLEWTMFDAVDLSGASDLETVEHRAPSAVTLATIYRSAGRVPESFLRGTQPDIPEDVLLKFRNTFRTSRFKYRSCFVSYSSKDANFVDHLTERFRRARVKHWRDQSALRSGEFFADRIVDAITRNDRFVVVLSKHAVKSEWVAKELALALENKRYEIRPIRIDKVVVEEHGEPFSQLRRLDVKENKPEWDDRMHIANFSRWKVPQVFEEQFKLLMDGLRRE